MLRTTMLQKVLLISLLVLWSTSQAGIVCAGINVWTSNGPEGGNIYALAIDPVTPATLYAGTYLGGVFESTNGGGNWSVVNTGLTNTSIQALTIDPVTPTTLYAGTYLGGVFKSTNGGGNWSALNTGLTHTDVRTLAIDPVTPTTLYAGTYLGGVFKSTNGGGNWSVVNIGLTDTGVKALAIDPATPTTLYAGTEGGVFRSTNGGGNWSAVNTGLTNTYVRALAIDPATPATLYAGTYEGVFKSTNGGGIWSAVNTGLPDTCVFALAIDPVAPTTLYEGTLGGVFKSTNGGGNWSAVRTGLTNTYVRTLTIDPATPTTLYAGTYSDGVFKSTNGGGNWSAVNTGLTNTDVYALVIDPATPTTLYVGTGGGGVFKSTNGGGNWSAFNTGLTHTDVRALAIDPVTPTTLYAGTNGGGVFAIQQVDVVSRTWHVATYGSDITGDGSEANPFATIQHGIDVASNGDTVLAHPGVYKENINFKGKNITVGSLLVTTGDEGYILQTVIDGNRNDHVVTFAGGEAATARLSGFTITNGYAHGTSSPGYHGGGVFCLNANPTLTHLKVSGNEAAQEGGGLYFDHCSSTIQDIMITNNLAGSGGGGIRYSYGSVSLENVMVAHNSARGDGAGAGIHFYHADGTVRNALIADNSGGTKGGGLHFDGCSPTFINVTVVGNWTAGHGGGLNVSYMSQPTLVNSIVWGNAPEQIYFDTDWWGEAVTIEYSNIQGGEAGIVTNGHGPVYWGDGNMDASPRFVNVGLGNYHLADDSPCIGVGKAAGAPSTDIEGSPRPSPAGSNPDMGAYENLSGSSGPSGLKVYLPIISKANDGLLVWYDFEDNFLTSGSVADRSGNGYDAQVNGTVDVTEGISGGQAIFFSGNGCIQAQSNPVAGRSNVSFSLWFKTDQPEANYKLASAAWWNWGPGSGWILATHIPEFWSDDTKSLYLPGLPNNENHFPAGEWVHEVVTYDGDRIREYTNGQLVNDWPTTGATIGQGRPMVVGAWPPFSAYNFQGSIDEFRIFARSLTQQEVEALYNQGR